MTDRELDRFKFLQRDALRETPDCLGDDTIAALAEGTLDDAARAAVLPHLAGCARCRRAVASVAGALADPRVARAVAAIERPQRRLLRIALPVAAAAAVLLVFAWPREAGREPGHRAPPDATALPVPVSPVGVVAEAKALQWTAVRDADRYRVTLSEADGHLLYEAEVSDTVVALPDSITLSPGRAYVWLVEARTAFDRWTTSPLVEFSTAKAAPP